MYVLLCMHFNRNRKDTNKNSYAYAICNVFLVVLLLETPKLTPVCTGCLVDVLRRNQLIFKQLSFQSGRILYPTKRNEERRDSRHSNKDVTISSVMSSVNLCDKFEYMLLSHNSLHDQINVFVLSNRYRHSMKIFQNNSFSLVLNNQRGK